MPFPVDSKYIQAAEKELNVLFPPSFTAKMIRENGGELEIDEEPWFLYPFFDTSDKKRISRTAQHIVLETLAARKWRNFPTNGVAIGDNGAGDKLVFMPKNEQSNILYIWRHETGEIFKAASSDYFSFT